MLEGQLTLYDALVDPAAVPLQRPCARIRAALDAADAGNYGKSGSAWASHIWRSDVEQLLAYAESHGA